MQQILGSFCRRWCEANYWSKPESMKLLRTTLSWAISPNYILLPGFSSMKLSPGRLPYIIFRVGPEMQESSPLRPDALSWVPSTWCHAVCAPAGIHLGSIFLSSSQMMMIQCMHPVSAVAGIGKRSPTPLSLSSCPTQEILIDAVIWTESSFTSWANHRSDDLWADRIPAEFYPTEH